MDEVMRTEKLTLVGTMVSSLLHDFKNPFAIINLGSNIIAKRHTDDPKTAAICENIDSQIRRMVNMANDLAAFAKGEYQVELTHVDLDKLFEQFKELNTPFFQDHKVELSMQGNGTSLLGDSSKLLRVLQNLVSNAIDALHAAEIDGKVIVDASENEEAIILQIADNGSGIPVDIRDRFFEPFVTKGKNDGTGLGTAIVKSIIDSHGGSIDFKTSARGTTFTICLPKLVEKTSEKRSA